MWVREQDQEKKPMTILSNNSLFISNVTKEDSGVYSCSKANSLEDEERKRMNVIVRSIFPLKCFLYNI